MARFLFALLGCGLLFGFAAHSLPDLFVEQTSSMTPLIQPGDLVISAKPSHGTVPIIGAIASYQFRDELITHRIIGESAKGFIFKGDANPSADPYPVTLAEIREVYLLHVPGAGTWLTRLTTPLGTMSIAGGIIVVGMLALFLRKRRPAPRHSAVILPWREHDRTNEEQRAA